MPVLMPVQQPVHYAVTATAPVRIGGLLPPYTLINGDVQGTIWLADNAGVIAGLGTPLHPGTSLVWNRQGDFFAISEAGFSNTLIISDVTDWEPDPAAIATAVLNAGILIIDNPVVLFQGSPTGAPNAISFTSDIDVSRYQSLLVEIELLAVSANNINAIRLRFADNADDIVYWYALNFGVVGETWVAQIPCTATIFQLAFYDNAQFQVRVMGSHRSVPGIIQRVGPQATAFTPPNNEIPTDLLWVRDQTYNAGNTVFTIAPWIGEIEINFRTVSAAAPGNSLLSLATISISPSPGIAQIVAQAALQNVGAAVFASVRYMANGSAMSITVSNQSGAVWVDNGLRVTPISGRGSVT